MWELIRLQQHFVVPTLVLRQMHVIVCKAVKSHLNWSINEILHSIISWFPHPPIFSCVLWNIDITIHPLFLRWCSPALMKLLKAIIGLNINMWYYFWIRRYTNLLIEGCRESHYIYKLLNFNICLTNLLVKLHDRCRCKYRLLYK